MANEYKRRLATASLTEARAMDKAYADAYAQGAKEYAYKGLKYAVKGAPGVTATSRVNVDPFLYKPKTEVKPKPIGSTNTSSTGGNDPWLKGVKRDKYGNPVLTPEELEIKNTPVKKSTLTKAERDAYSRSGFPEPKTEMEKALAYSKSWAGTNPITKEPEQDDYWAKRYRKLGAEQEAALPENIARTKREAATRAVDIAKVKDFDDKQAFDKKVSNTVWNATEPNAPYEDNPLPAFIEKPFGRVINNYFEKRPLTENVGDEFGKGLRKTFGYAYGGSLPKMWDGGPFDPTLDPYAQAQAMQNQYGTGQTAAGATGAGRGLDITGRVGNAGKAIAVGAGDVSRRFADKDSGYADAASPALQAGSQIVNMVDGMDGKPSKLGGIASGALSGASMGANPALVAATGGLSIAAGAAIGGGLALLQAEKAKKEQEKAEKKYMNNLTDQNNFMSQQTLRNYSTSGVTSTGSYAYGGELPEYGKGGKIHIKKKNRGKFTAYKKRTGKTTEEALHSKDPHVRQMANFARNAKKWKHKGRKKKHALGGDLYANGGDIKKKPVEKSYLDRAGELINEGTTKVGRAVLPINAAMYAQDVTGNMLKKYTGENFLTRGPQTPLTEKDLTPEELGVMRTAQRTASDYRDRYMERFPEENAPKELSYDAYPETSKFINPDPSDIGGLVHAVADPSNRMMTTIGGAMYHRNKKGEDVITDRFNFAGKQEQGLAKENAKKASLSNPYGYLHGLIADEGSTKEEGGIPVNINLGKAKPKAKPMKRIEYIKKFALGGMPEPEYEVEEGEMVQGQPTLEQGQQVASDMYSVGGERHENGGTEGAGGERVFSDRLKTANKKTYAEEAKELAKQKAKFEEKIPSTNEAVSNTGHRMSERIDMKLDNLFNEQEMKKMYAMPPSVSSSMATMRNGGNLPKYPLGVKLPYSLNQYQYGKGPGASINPLPRSGGWNTDPRSLRPTNAANRFGEYNAGTRGRAFGAGTGEYVAPGRTGSTGVVNPYPEPVMMDKQTGSQFYVDKDFQDPNAIQHLPYRESKLEPIKFDKLPLTTLPAVKPTVGDDGTGGATAKAVRNGNGIPWQYVDNLASGIMTANTPELAKPYMDPRVDLNTTYDINPQLSSARNTRDAVNRSISASTPQGGASAANRQQLFASSVENENSLYAQKNNIENELKNKEILLNSGINSRNNDKRYAYDVENVKRRAGIQEDIVGNARNFAVDQYTSARDAKMDARDLENIKQIAMANPNGANYGYDLKAFADVYASDPKKLDTAITQMQAISPDAPALQYLINMRKNLTGK
jgi:hypothetical protein